MYAYKTETFGPQGTLGRVSEREVVLVRDLRAALTRLNPELPESAREQAIEKPYLQPLRSLNKHLHACYTQTDHHSQREFMDSSRNRRCSLCHGCGAYSPFGRNDSIFVTFFDRQLSRQHSKHGMSLAV